MLLRENIHLHKHNKSVFKKMRVCVSCNRHEFLLCFTFTLRSWEVAIFFHIAAKWHCCYYNKRGQEWENKNSRLLTAVVRKHDCYQFCVILYAPCVCISLPWENNCLSLRQPKRITAAGNGEISLLIFWNVNKAWVMSGGGVNSEVGSSIQRTSCTQKWSSNTEGAVQGHTWKRNRTRIHNPRVHCLPLHETEAGTLAFWGWFQYAHWSIGHLFSQQPGQSLSPPHWFALSRERLWPWPCPIWGHVNTWKYPNFIIFQLAELG